MKSETIRVLLIDDDEDDYVLTRDLLAGVKIGEYVLDWASSYEEGLKIAGGRQHHVCLVDYRLGERSGVQLIREARELRLTTPMILLTGQGDHEVDVKAMEAGATDYLVKDETSPSRLERTIRYAVQINLERCRTETKLAAHAQKQAVVAEISRQALTGLELEDLFDEAVTLVARTLGVECSEVLELLPDGEALILRAGVGWKENHQVGHATVSSSKESQAGFTLLSDEPVVVEDLRTETRFSGPLLLHEHGVVSGMSVVIRERANPFGVLAAHTTSARSFVADDVSFLKAVANILAEAIGRKRAEADKAQLTVQIESQRLRLNNIVASVPGVVWESWSEPDAVTQRINFVSEYVVRMLGYGVEEWVSTPNFWLSIVHPGDRQRVGRIAAEDFVGQRNSTQEFRWVARDGHALWVESKSVVIVDDEGRSAGLRGVTLDITERKKLEEQLRQAQKMEAIGTLAGGIAHDFNNILAAIIGYSELAQGEIAPDSVAQDHLVQVLRASSRARDLVRQILTFSRQEELERQTLLLQPIIEEAINLLRTSLPSSIEIHQHIDPAAPSVLADPTLIQQVILNLGANAGQSIKEHGVVEIRLATVDIDHDFAGAHPEISEGPHVQLTVSDTGCGMDRATLERIFDPFFTTKPPGEGTGLGLAVVHGVIKNHEGTITVYSEVGMGTTFNIYLPVCDHQRLGISQQTRTVPRGNGEHILFVDDEEMLASLGKSMLQNLGYRVTTKLNGAEALAAFKAAPGEFDLVVTDQTMPHLNGADLGRALVEIRPELPVILATGYSATISSQQAKALGIRELLFKPITMRALGDAISRAFGDRRKE